MATSLMDSLTPRPRPAIGPGGHTRRRHSNKGRHFPADPPRTEEIIAVMRCCDDTPHGARARGLVVVLWRAGLRIQEALDLNELDLDRRRGSVLVRRGKGGRRREIGMDDWGFEQLEPWLEVRRAMPVGPFCFSASSMARAAGARGSPLQLAPCSADSPRALASAAASPHTSSATRTRSSSPTKASRST
jgi:integrase